MAIISGTDTRNPKQTHGRQQQGGEDVIDHLPTCGELAAYFDREANLPDDEKGPGGSLGARSGGALLIPPL